MDKKILLRLKRWEQKSEKKHQKFMKKAGELDKEINSYQKHFLAGDQYYKQEVYEKAIKEWKIAKRIGIGAGYPYKQLPKVYRKLAMNNLKQDKFKAALKWYKELEDLIKEAKQLIKKGKARSMILWNLKLGPRDEKQIKAIHLKLGRQRR